jgi:hypothetical protein
VTMGAFADHHASAPALVEEPPAGRWNGSLGPSERDEERLSQSFVDKRTNAANGRVLLPSATHTI